MFRTWFKNQGFSSVSKAATKNSKALVQTENNITFYPRLFSIPEEDNLDPAAQWSDRQAFEKKYFVPTLQAISPIQAQKIRYTDVDLLNHPLFQRILHRHTKNKLWIEFYAKLVNFRLGRNAEKYSIQNEAVLLFNIFIARTSIKYVGYVSKEIQEGIQKNIKNQTVNRMLYWEAEYQMEKLLISYPVKYFKTTLVFKKLLPFITFDRKQLIKNKELREKFKSDREEVAFSLKIIK
ncbi:MAG: hypothetical protein P4M12_00805 [Gammaproteobacteria bacterium]|nr:hypothetical protein [Gammaproteobacteria bacterium]